VVASPQWLVEEDGDNQAVDLVGVQRILIKAQDVEMVEMMRPVTQEDVDGRSKGANAAAAASGAAHQECHTRPTTTVPARSAAATATEAMTGEDPNG
jgi:hypothetical protein